MKSTLTLSAALLAAVTLGTTAMTAVPAFADDDVTLNTTAKAAFTAGDTDTTTPPVDPETPDPETPVDPEEPGGVTPGTPSALSLDWAPNLDFGSNEISNTTKTYYAKAQKFADGTYHPNYVQVTDKRGTFDGWNLTVKTDGQFRLDATADEKSGGNTATGGVLTGTTMAFDKGTVNGVEGVDAQYAPTTQISTSTPISTAASNVMNAAAGNGMGTWVNSFGASSDYAENGATTSPISINVPGTTIKKAATYTTNLTWTLSNTPDM